MPPTGSCPVGQSRGDAVIVSLAMLTGAMLAYMLWLVTFKLRRDRLLTERATARRIRKSVSKSSAPITSGVRNHQSRSLS